MLLGTHPIPARSPAEREGQNGKETRREGDREKVGILGGGELRTMVIHEEGKREKMEGLLFM